MTLSRVLVTVQHENLKAVPPIKRMHGVCQPFLHKLEAGSSSKTW